MIEIIITLMDAIEHVHPSIVITYIFIISIFGNMCISIMVQIKFNRHTLYIIGVHWMVSTVYNVLYIG